MRRGEIWWADLPSPHRSEPAKARPVLVIQSDRLNDLPLRTVIVVCLTSQLRWAKGRGNVRLSKRDTKLARVSVANVSQVLTLDRSRLRDRVGTLPEHRIRQVDEGLRLAMELGTVERR